MLRKTDLEKVKRVAELLLLTRIHKTKYSPAIVRHPFTSCGIVWVVAKDKVQLLDVTKSDIVSMHISKKKLKNYFL